MTMPQVNATVKSFMNENVSESSKKLFQFVGKVAKNVNI